MKAASFTYHCPTSLDEALHLLASLDNARLLAGGQSLVPMLNLRLAAPDHLIDLGRISTLTGIDENTQGLSIGAMTTQRQVERSTLAEERCPLLSEAIFHVGHQQTRNRGTVGGSLCHLDPAAELPVVAAALDATLEATSIRGVRRIAFRDFPAGYLTSQLQADEILTRVDFPARDATTGWAFVEFSRRPADFAIVSVAAMVSLDASVKIAKARIAIGGLGPAPQRMSAAEALIVGQRWDAALSDALAANIAACPAEGDSLYSGEYRQHLAAVLARRAIEKALKRAQDGDDV